VTISFRSACLRCAGARLLVALVLATACSGRDASDVGATVFQRIAAGAGAGILVKEVKARAGDEYRNVLASPGGEVPVADWISAPIVIPPDAELDFGIAFDEGALLRSDGGFRIVAEHEGGPTELFARDLGHSEEWKDFRVDLAALANREVRLRFESAGAAANGRWSNPILISSSERPKARPPSLLLISLDTLRADRLGTWGYARDTSPNLDRFMREGLVFERCYAPSSWTTPSHASVFTGHHPAVHGAGGPRGHRLQERFTTLAELARQSGLLTAAFTEGVAVSGQLGFDLGFDLYANGRGPRPRPAGAAAKTFERAEDWLARYGDLPFLMFVHTYEIHWPYRSPEPFSGKFDDTGGALSVEEVTNPEALFGELSDAKQRAYEAAYDAGVAYTDSIVGRFLDGLRDAGRLENTIVVIFSDHGEEFWEHGGTSHGLSLYDEVLHVPLFIRLPGAHSPRGRISRQVSLGDVFATLVELLGFEATSPASSHSLVPLWQADSSAREYARKHVTSELFQSSAQWLMLSLRGGDEKYIATTDFSHPESPLHDDRATLADSDALSLERRLVEHLLAGGRDLARAGDEAERMSMLRSAREELYELETDPGETQDRGLDSPDGLRAARREFAAELARLRAEIDSIAAPPEPVDPLTEAERVELRALGYLE
jgi:arylsulfatase A-like enzyme